MDRRFGGGTRKRTLNHGSDKAPCMLGILLYAIGVMYTPGPVNIISLNIGAQGRFKAHIPFLIGIWSVLCFYFLLIGYAGRMVVNDRVLPFIAIGGVCFILHLAYRILTSTIKDVEGSRTAVLTFKDGVLMQLLNPKVMLVVLPVATVQFPAAGIDGAGVALWSLLLSGLGLLAAFIYAGLGASVSRRLRNTKFLRYINVALGLMLIAVAADMAWHHVYLAFRSL